MTEGISKLTYALVAFVFGVLITVIISMFALQSDSKILISQSNYPVDTSLFDPGNSDNQKSPSSTQTVTFAQPDKTMSLDEMLHLSSGFDQSAALFVRLIDASEDEVLDLLDESMEIERSRGQDGILGVIFARLTAINPYTALERLNDVRSTQRRSIIREIFHEWAHSDVNSAMHATDKLPMSQRLYALEAILQTHDVVNETQREELIRKSGYGANYMRFSRVPIGGYPELDEDPAVAWEQLTEEPNNTASYNVLLDVAIDWVDRDGIEVLDQINDSLAHGRTRSLVLSGVVNSLSLDDPHTVLNYLQQLPQNSDTRTMTASVFGTWVDSNPEAAYSAASELDRTQSSFANRQSVLQYWGYYDPDAVLDIIDTLPRQLQSSSYMQVMGRITQESPERAARLIEGIDDESLQRRLNGQLASNWSSIDPAAAIEWIQSQPEDTISRSAFRTAAEHLAGSNPEEAFRLASRQSGDTGHSMEVAVMSVIARNDVDLAIDLLGQTRAESRVESATNIGENLVRHDPDRALRLGSTLKDDDRDKYFNSLVHQWAYRAPHSLMQKIDDLPSARVRSNAAKILLNNRGSRNFLSEDQRALLYNKLNEEDRKYIDRRKKR